MKPAATPEADTVTVRIPMRLERNGVRKLVVAPDGVYHLAQFAVHVTRVVFVLRRVPALQLGGRQVEPREYRLQRIRELAVPTALALKRKRSALIPVANEP